MMKKILLALTLCATLSSTAQVTQKLTAGKSNDYGLIYSLPVTVLDITVEVERTVKEPGEFYKYATKYLNENNPVTARSQSWQVKSVKVNPRGVPNQEERYLMTFKGGAAPYIIMDENDLPIAINTENIPAVNAPVLPQPVEAKPTPLQTSAARQVITEEMLQSQSIAKRAELAAAKIYELRQSRNDLITGQADKMPDGNAMQIIMDQLAAQEAALTAMFVGTEQTSTAVMTYTYTPGDDVSRHILARVSALDGLVAPDDLSGDPITLNLKVTERGKMPVNEKGEPKTMPKGGVAYCVPGTAHLSVNYNGKEFWSGSFDAAQYGVVFGLDPKLFTDKKAPAYLLLNPATGGIKELGTVNQ